MLIAENTQHFLHFLHLLSFLYASGLYSYEVISSQTSPSDGTVFTLISIEGQKCTYWFRDGLLTLDFGMAYDAPGYYFKKLKK